MLTQYASVQIESDKLLRTVGRYLVGSLLRLRIPPFEFVKNYLRFVEAHTGIDFELPI